MILLLVLIGFIVGVSAAGVSLIGGAGLIAALAAYSFFGVLAVVAAALVIELAPFRPARGAAPHAVPTAPGPRWRKAQPMSPVSARVTGPIRASHAPGTRATPRTRWGLVGGGISTPSRMSNPKRA